MKIYFFKKRKYIFHEVWQKTIMVNKCVVINCVSDYKTGENKSSVHFPENKDLNESWICFVNRKNRLPSKNSVRCIDHFEKKFIKYGKKNVNWCGN